MEFSQFLASTLTVPNDGIIKAGFEIVKNNRKVQIDSMEFDDFVRSVYNN
jgi:hypothetical protein